MRGGPFLDRLVAVRRTSGRAGSTGGVRLVADHSAALDRFKGAPTTTVAPRPTVPAGPAPAAGQFFVKGSVDKLTAEGAQGPPIATPFTIAAVERGTGKASIQNVLVDGKRTSIAWGGGTPLPITGDGGTVDLSGSKVVAVGLGGLATPRDSVEFTADAQTVIASQGGVVVKVPPANIEVTGPGKVTVNGQLQVRDSKTTKPATSVQFGEGPYKVTLTPAGGRFDLDAVLQGPLTSS